MQQCLVTIERIFNEREDREIQKILIPREEKIKLI